MAAADRFPRYSNIGANYYVVISGRLLVAFSKDDSSLCSVCAQSSRAQSFGAELFGAELFRAPSFRVSDGKTAMQAVGRDVAILC